ncbi:MAG: histidine kinase [Chlamydiae bacterium]|nr:MAG: histidine kinase [Chlamydiota bacterium]
MSDAISLSTVKKNHQDISVISELMYQLKVRDVMTKNVCTVTPENTLREVQKAMRDNKISGVPVVSKDNILVGIISLDDIIRALDSGEMNCKAEEKMTRNVQTVGGKVSVIKAIDEMEQCGFGRLPVIDKEHKLVGIVTHWDVVRKLIFLLQDVVLKAEKRERSLADTAPAATNEIEGATFEFEVCNDDFENAGIAASTVKKQLQKMEVSPAIIRRVAVAMYETEINIIIHSLGGKMSAEIFPDHIRVVSKDRGPGIANVEKALTEGFSTASAKAREMGFGAGMGLPNIKRCVDNFKIESSAGGSTTITFGVNFDDKGNQSK